VTEYIKEGWDGEFYYLKAEFSLDKNKILKRLKTIQIPSPPTIKTEGTIQEIFEKASRSQNSSDYKNAIMLYKRLLEMDKNFVYAYYEIGNIYRTLKDFDKAIQWYKKAIKIDPNFPDAYYNLGTTLGVKGDFEKGIKYIEHADSLGYDENMKKTKKPYITVSTDELEINIPKKSKKPIEQEEEKVETEEDLQPLETKKLYKEFDKLLENKQPASNEQTVDSEENFPDEISLEEIPKGEQTEIDKEFKSLLEARQEENISEYSNKREAIKDFFQKGSLAFMKGNFTESIDYYRRVLQLSPANSSSYYSIGTIYARMQNYQKAVEYLEKAIKLNPDFAKAYDNLGFVYYKMTEYNNAIKYLKQAVEKDSTLANAYCNLGDTYYKLNQHKKKIQYYKKAAKLGDEKAREFLTNIDFTW